MVGAMSIEEKGESTRFGWSLGGENEKDSWGDIALFKHTQDNQRVNQAYNINN